MLTVTWLKKESVKTVLKLWDYRRYCSNLAFRLSFLQVLVQTFQLEIWVISSHFQLILLFKQWGHLFFIQFLFSLHCPSGVIKGRETKCSEMCSWACICNFVYFWHNSPFWHYLIVAEVSISIYLQFDFVMIPFHYRVIFQTVYAAMLSGSNIHGAR